jgi:hypothetical protein
MINLQGLHLLSEIGGVSMNVNLIADMQRSRFDPNYCDRQVIVIVRDNADALLPRGGLRGRLRRGRRRARRRGVGARLVFLRAVDFVTVLFLRFALAFFLAFFLFAMYNLPLVPRSFWIRCQSVGNSGSVHRNR